MLNRSDNIILDALTSSSNTLTTPLTKTLNVLKKRFQQLYENSRKSIKAHQSDYWRFALSKHHGEDLHDPHMLPSFRRFLLDAHQNGDARIAELDAQEKEFMKLLEDIDKQQALTDANREKLNEVKNCHSIRKGKTEYYSEMMLVFDEILLPEDKQETETLNKIREAADPTIMATLNRLTAENVKEIKTTLLIQCLVTKLKSLMLSDIKAYENPLEYADDYARRYAMREDLMHLPAPPTVESYEKLRQGKKTALKKYGILLDTLDPLLKEPILTTKIRDSLQEFKKKVRVGQTTLLIDALLERLQLSHSIQETDKIAETQALDKDPVSIALK